jgi:hypothetical protein
LNSEYPNARSGDFYEHDGEWYIRLYYPEKRTAGKVTEWSTWWERGERHVANRAAAWERRFSTAR